MKKEQLTELLYQMLARSGLADSLRGHLERAFGGTDPDTVDASKSRVQSYVDLVVSEGLTLRQLLQRLAGARGHFTTAGTPEQVADTIADWFASGAADGFNVMPPILSSQFEVFTAEVVPLLQRRGLFREHYTGTTLREHLGLSPVRMALPHPLAA